MSIDRAAMTDEELIRAVLFFVNDDLKVVAEPRLLALLTQNQKMREALEQVERLRVYCEVEGVDMPMNRLQEAIEGRCFPREAEPLPKATI